jgi:mannose-6-phosphate isomerase-like protein (cupin superfamily)
LRAHAAEPLNLLPGPRLEERPGGERFVEAFTRDTPVVELHAACGRDPQSPHDRDEVYFVISDSGDFVGRHARFSCGDALFIGARIEHRGENFSDDLATWIVPYGPQVGEKP